MCPMLLLSSLTFPCSGGNPPWALTPNHHFVAIGVSFMDQLNVYFGQPDLALASKCTLCALKMHNYQHVNQYMIEFSKHAMHTGWNDVALYGEFYQGLAECIKDQLLSLDCPQTFQQLKADTLKCNTCYWECQGEKVAPFSQNRQSTFTSAPEKSDINLAASSDAQMTSHTNPGTRADVSTCCQVLLGFRFLIRNSSGCIGVWTLASAHMLQSIFFTSSIFSYGSNAHI